MTQVIVSSGKVMEVDERNLSRTGNKISGGGDQDRLYVVTGSDNEVDVEEALLSVAPPSTDGGLIFNGPRYAPDYIDGNQSIWFATVQYVSNAGGELGSRQVDLGTARLRLTVGTEDQIVVEGISGEPKKTSVRGNNDAIEYQGIGDNGKTFDGTNVAIPTFGFSYDFHVPGLRMDASYFSSCRNAVATVNSVAFKGFDKGEVLCSAITGTFVLGENSILSFEFKVKKNQPALFSRDQSIQRPSHLGWEFIDVHTSTKIENKHVIVTIEQIDVWQIFELRDFNKLEIPGDDIEVPQDQQ